MLTEQPILVTSIIADADDDGFVISKNLLVGFDGRVLGNASKQLGVCYADTVKGEQMPVIVAGIALVKTSDVVTKGAPVMCDDEGLISNWSDPSPIVGYALDAASGAGQLIRILLT